MAISNNSNNSSNNNNNNNNADLLFNHLGQPSEEYGIPSHQWLMPPEEWHPTPEAAQPDHQKIVQGDITMQQATHTLAASHLFAEPEYWRGTNDYGTPSSRQNYGSMSNPTSSFIHNFEAASFHRNRSEHTLYPGLREPLLVSTSGQSVPFTAFPSGVTVTQEQPSSELDHFLDSFNHLGPQAAPQVTKNPIADSLESRRRSAPTLLQAFTASRPQTRTSKKLKRKRSLSGVSNDIAGYDRDIKKLLIRNLSRHETNIPAYRLMEQDSFQDQRSQRAALTPEARLEVAAVRMRGACFKCRMWRKKVFRRSC